MPVFPAPPITPYSRTNCHEVSTNRSDARHVTSISRPKNSSLGGPPRVSAKRPSSMPKNAPTMNRVVSAPKISPRLQPVSSCMGPMNTGIAQNVVAPIMKTPMKPRKTMTQP